MYSLHNSKNQHFGQDKFAVTARVKAKLFCRIPFIPKLIMSSGISTGLKREIQAI